MRNFKLVCLMAMAGLLLFLGGCQKEEALTNLKLENTFKLKGYNPVFDTIPKDVFGRRNTIDSVPFQAPTTAELVQLSEDLKTISSSHSIAQKAISLKKAGNVLNYNYSMIYHNVQSPNGYLITMPFINDDKVTAILIYTRFDENKFFVNIYSKSDIETILSAELYSNVEIYKHYNIINLFVNFQFTIENSVDSMKADWLKVNSRIVSRNPAGRCVVSSYLVPVIEHVAFVPTQPNFAPHYTWGWTTVYQILCDQDHNGYIGEGTTLTGSNGSAGSNGLQPIEIELVDKFPGLDTDCLRLLQSDIKEKLLNAVSPCDADNFANKIMQAFNNSCTKAKQEGGNNFLQNIEMWEFSESIKNALDGVDYVDDSELNYNPGLPLNCNKINCIWKQIKSKTRTVNESSYSCVMDIMGEFIDGLLNVEIGYSQNPIFSPTGTSINAQTVPHSTFGGHSLLFNTRININSELCNELNNKSKEPLEVVGMFLHEMVHARLFEHLYNNGFTIDQLRSNNYKELWDNFVQLQFPGIIIGQTQHQLMAQEYVSDIAFAMYQLNGNLGTPDDYLIFAWQGLADAFDSTQKATYNFIPTATHLDTMKTRYIENVRHLEKTNKEKAITSSCK